MSEEPDLLDLEAEMAKLADANAAVEAALSDVEGSESVALVATADASEVKKRLAARHSDLVRARHAVAEQQKRVRAALDAKKAEMDRMVRAMELELAPVKEQVELIQEGIWTINLYLGRDESITTIATGEPAPESEPIAVHQLVLYMDEESLIAADEGGMDADDVEDFDQWITSNPAHLHQVLPDLKGIVAIKPRRRAKSYENPWQGQAMAEENRKTYWLIRNGENLYRMHTDLDVGESLIPKSDEFTSFFTEQVYDRDAGGFVGRPIRPGSNAWLKAEKAAGARQRHFMRVALVLQGVVDRSTVLRPFPAGLSFLEPAAYDSGAVRVVIDDERQLGSGRKPFKEWRAEANSKMRVGMRVVGNWYGSREEDRVSPTGAPCPKRASIQTIEAKGRHGTLKFFYRRTDERWGYEHGDYGEWGSWPYKQRASYSIFPGDTNVLCIDAVTAEEIETYLAARTERHAYESMVPLLKVALDVKRAEAEAEAPMRLLVIAELAKRNQVDVADAEAVVDDLISWYKIENRWNRALVPEDGDVEAGVIDTIVAEHATRIRLEADRQTTSGRDAKVLAKLQAAHPDAVLIARRNDGYFLTFVPERDDCPFVREIKTSPTGRASSETRWALIGHRHHRWEILHTGQAWDGWDIDADPNKHLTDDEWLTLLSDVLADAALPQDAWGWGADPETVPRRVASLHLDTTNWAGERRYRRLVVRSIPEGPMQARVPDRLLTRWDEAKEVKLNEFTYEWSKDRHGVSFRTHRSNHASDENLVELFTDPALIAEVEAANMRFVDALERRSVMADRAGLLERSIINQWEAWALAATYARFLEDYLDPELWEVHVKAHPVPTFPFRSRYHSSAAHRPLIEMALDLGLAPEGLTIGELRRLVTGIEPDADFSKVPADLDEFILWP